MTIENRMINLYPTQIESISLHRIGNKNKNEGVFLSDEPFRLNDETTGLLREYFFRPFREKEENYFKLSHEVDIAFNELYKTVTAILDAPTSAHENSKKIARHLFEQSNHPHIKSGEVYVAYLTGVLLDNVKVDAVGIFKSELKHDFLQFEEKGSNLDLVIQQGININKLDKGCLIFNEFFSGFRIYKVHFNLNVGIQIYYIFNLFPSI